MEGHKYINLYYFDHPIALKSDLYMYNPYQ